MMNLKLSKAEICSFMSAMIVGFFAHAFIFFNNITLHDNTYNFYMGGTYQSGRWMLGILTRLTDILSGTNYLHYNAPWYVGAISLFWIAVSGVIIVRMLDIKNVWIGGVLGAVLVSFPTTISLFGYMFTSGMYTFGTMLGVLGVYLTSKRFTTKIYINIPLVVMGIGFEACSVGVYQANIAIISSLTLLVFLHQLVEDKNAKLLGILKKIGYYFGITVAYMACYYAVNKFFLWKQGKTMNYREMSTALDGGVGQYISRIGLCYSRLVQPENGGLSNMFPGGIGIYYRIFLVSLLLLAIYYGFIIYRKNVLHGVIYSCVIIIFPIAANIIFVMCDTDIYAMMMYGQTMFFVLALMLTYYIISDNNKSWKKMIYVVLANILIIVFLYCRLANICYQKADYVEKAGIAYFNRMITKIETVEGYKSDMPVAFIGNEPRIDSSLFLYTEYNDIYIGPFGQGTVIDDHLWKEFMKSTCGYSPIYADESQFSENAEVKGMLCYPDEGSIRIIDNTVVVKLQ